MSSSDALHPIVPISDYWQNRYQRSPTELEGRESVADVAHVLGDGRTAQLRDGTRLRITPRGQPTVEDLVHPGDLVRASWMRDGEDGEMEVERIVRVQSHMEYGIRVSDIVYARLDAPRTKTGKLRVLDLNVMPELVAQDGRVLAFFENNADEVFVTRTAVLLFG